MDPRPTSPASAPVAGTDRPLPLTRSLAAAAALALLALAGCSSSSDSASAGDGDAIGRAATTDGGAPAAATESRSELAYGDADNAFSALSSARDAGASSATAEEPTTPSTPGATRALIKQGNVALRSDDVGAARFDVQKIVDTYRGELAEESTEASEDGEPERARLVLRVPVAAFTDVMGELEEVADLISTTSSVEDVTTQVIDTGVRVQLQRRSIDRISELLDRASSIRDIVNIERELSRREADLGSLEKRQTFLRGQAARSTITVSIERPDEKEGVTEKKDEDGFVAGLEKGWDAFTGATVGLLTALGAVLPFAVLLALLWVPGRAVLRRRHAHAPTTSATSPATP
ncbi:DUF4349 domain-containing protein [Nocardioides sp. R-C-SC26]|uniref:DUF4349 domain-containing protein n=1 Tax=Nocardioides sp. R-C-SC26 TaxID=2870414 RepID=UPI001E5FF0D5|nr:DUF4349 domain-containing protein [Nocardioides sp. R-C-SC26]